jgi:glutamine amidotransferase-like uncharacterized protein
MRINIYSDKGVRVPTPLIWQEFFNHHYPDAEVHYVSGKNILQGGPQGILFPGGSASVFARTLGKRGRKRIADWVQNGGTYIGVCAGAYLASSTYEWSLGISPAKIAKPWKRGHHQVRILLGNEYKTVDYFNGPIFEKWPGVEILARYMDDIPDAAGQHNMPTTPAIIKNDFGKGKVLLFSPHLEKTEELRDVLYELLSQVLTDK